MNSETIILLAPVFFLIAMFYSSVGFGGGSSYLALMALTFTDIPLIRTVALLCNLLVVTGSVYWYFRSGHIRIHTFLPFVLVSIPMAYFGATLRLSDQAFYILLGLSLIASALLLLVQSTQMSHRTNKKNYPQRSAWLLGGGIGFLAGLVGIGGGIFLSPLLNHLRWEVPVKIAALASFFILVNSVSGLGGLAVSGNFAWQPEFMFPLFLAVLVGGQMGIRLSLKKLNPWHIRQVTALLVFLVGSRVLLVNGLEVL